MIDMPIVQLNSTLLFNDTSLFNAVVSLIYNVSLESPILIFNFLARSTTRLHLILSVSVCSSNIALKLLEFRQHQIKWYLNQYL